MNLFPLSASHKEAANVRAVRPFSPYYRWIILAVVFVTLFTVVSAMGIVTLFIHTWADVFKWDVGAITVALSIQLIFNGLSGVIGGHLGDRFGPKRLLIVLLGLAVVGLLGIASMKSLWQLYLFYGVFLGIGTTLFPITTPLVARWFPKGRGFVLGIIQQGDLLGLAALSPLMLSANQNTGWRMSWLTMGLITLVIVLPVICIFIRGSGPDSAASSQKKGAEGATVREALRHRSFWGLAASNFFCGWTARYFWLLVAPVAQEGGMTPAQVGITVSIAGLAALPGMLFFGAACDRVSRTRLISVNFAVRCAVFLLMAVYLRTHQSVLMFVAAAVAGFITRSTAPPFSVAMINCFGFRSLGTLLGITSMGHQIAAALSLFLAGYIFDRTGSYAPTILGASALLVVASFVAGHISERKYYGEAVAPRPAEQPTT